MGLTRQYRRLATFLELFCMLKNQWIKQKVIDLRRGYYERL